MGAAVAGACAQGYAQQAGTAQDAPHPTTGPADTREEIEGIAAELQADRERLADWEQRIIAAREAAAAIEPATEAQIREIAGLEAKLEALIGSGTAPADWQVDALRATARRLDRLDPALAAAAPVSPLADARRLGELTTLYAAPDGEMVAPLAADMVVTVLGATDDGRWVLVDAGGQFGFVPAAAVAP